jgi:ABC-type polysaccharide/polyol phosphate export permease
MINRIFGPLLSKLPENNKLERIWVLAKTDFIERYYGTRLGVVWALINPFFQLMVYYVAFTLLFSVKIPNFALYVFSGLIFMMFFSEATTKGLSLLQRYKPILENINIHKLDLYLSAILSTFMGFAFNFLIYLLLSLFFNVNYNAFVLYTPLIILNLCIFVLATQLLLGIINIFVRDINHLWDMALLLLFWGSPIFYGKEIILEKLPVLLYLNPLAGVFINLREVLLFGSPPLYNLLLLNFIESIVLLVISLVIFKKYSSRAVEIL